MDPVNGSNNNSENFFRVILENIKWFFGRIIRALPFVKRFLPNDNESETDSVKNTPISKRKVEVISPQFKEFMDDKISFEKVKEIITTSPCEPGIPDLFKYCVEKGHLEHVKELITLGVDPSNENYTFYKELSCADTLEKAIRSGNTELIKLIASKVVISESAPLSIQKVCNECNLSLDAVKNILSHTPAWEKLQGQFLYVELDKSQPHGAKLINVTELITQIQSESLSQEDSKYITITQDGKAGLWHAAMHLKEYDLLFACLKSLNYSQNELDNMVLEAISLNRISLAEDIYTRIRNTDQRFRLIGKINDTYGKDKNEEVRLWAQLQGKQCQWMLTLQAGKQPPEPLVTAIEKCRKDLGDFYDKMYEAKSSQSPSIPVNTTHNQLADGSETESLTELGTLVETTQTTEPVTVAETEQKTEPVTVAETEQKTEPVTVAETEQKTEPVTVAETTQKTEPVTVIETTQETQPVAVAETKKNPAEDSSYKMRRYKFGGGYCDSFVSWQEDDILGNRITDLKCMEEEFKVNPSWKEKLPSLFGKLVEKGDLDKVQQLINLKIGPTEKGKRGIKETGDEQILWKEQDLLTKAIHSKNTELIKLIASNVVISHSDPLRIQKVCNECELSLDEVENIFSDTPAWEKLRRQFSYVKLDPNNKSGGKLINIDQLKSEIDSGSLDYEACCFINVSEILYRMGLFQVALQCREDELLFLCLDKVKHENGDLDDLLDRALFDKKDYELAQKLFDRIKSDGYRRSVLSLMLGDIKSDEHLRICDWILRQNLLTDEQISACKEKITKRATKNNEMDEVKHILQSLNLNHKFE